MRRAAALFALLLSVLLVLSACSAGAASYPQTTTPAESPTVTAIRTAIGEINVTAGATVATQRAVLDKLAAPDQAGGQRDCQVATTTLAFDPVYDDLRRADPGTSGDYVLPTYITIYSGARIIGSDLANLKLWIVAGVARTSALCVS